MGWTIDIKSNKPITTENVELVVRELPEKFQSPFLSGSRSRQDWGWSLAVDIYNPKGDTLTLHGSFGMSGHIAEEAARQVAAGLERHGHLVIVGPISG